MTSVAVPFPLAGVDPAWSRTVSITDSDGITRTVHVLDSWNGRESGVPELTVLCVHGNPTWSYLWRRLVSLAPAQWRVVAVDQIGMGFSERTGSMRRLAQRIDDLGAITAALGIDGPVATVAHDWGGPVSLGWALAHPELLVGVVLTNTAVSQPPASPAPRLIRAVRSPGVLNAMTVRTQGFLRGTLRLGPHRMSAEIRQGFLAPYPTAQSREAIGDFVTDIPLDASHPSFAALDAVAEGVRGLQVPVLLAWGPSDPVFSDLYLNDLAQRMPHADVHRYVGASHLVTEDAPQAIPDILTWLSSLPSLSPLSSLSSLSPLPSLPSLPSLSPLSHRGHPSAHLARSDAPVVAADAPEARHDLLEGLRSRSRDESAAIVELGGSPRIVSWRELSATVDALAAGFMATGISAGDRVAVLIPPGADLTACVYACWRIGAVVVAVDAGLGVRGMGRALRSAAPRHLIAVGRGLALARAVRLSVSGQRILVGTATASSRALGADALLRDLIALGASTELPAAPYADAEAVVVFTSGATGPAKGVVYRHEALEAQRDALRALYSIEPDDALVAAFPPWAVLGPALSIATAVPDMDPTSPGTLTASALADAVQAVKARLVWASPAAVRAVVETADELSPLQRIALEQVRLLMSAGAPVPLSLLERSLMVMPNADPHTPYGMTEALPISDISLSQLREAGIGNGVCVGWPVPGVTLRVDPLDSSGEPRGEPSDAVAVTGEICVNAPHLKDRYDRLWGTERAATTDDGWHRTGDVGHLDAEGRLWVEGRRQHVVSTDRGPVTPVAIEQAVERLPGIVHAAAVGVGPRGTEQLVVVVVTDEPTRQRSPLASLELLDQVRAAVTQVSVSTVLIRKSLPVDRRHNSKIDRQELAAWAADVLAGSGRTARR